MRYARRTTPVPQQNNMNGTSQQSNTNHSPPTYTPTEPPPPYTPSDSTSTIQNNPPLPPSSNQPINPDTRPLPEGWTSQYNPSSGLFFYIHTATSFSQEEHPSTESPSDYDNSQPTFDPPSSPPFNQPVNPDTRPLPEGWISRYDRNSDCFFYVNTALALRQWQHPSDQSSNYDPPSSPPPNQPVNPDTRPLPEDWISQYDRGTNRFFYIHTIIALRQWEHPSDRPLNDYGIPQPSFDPPSSPPSNQPVNPDTRPLPRGWISQYDRDSRRFFYVYTVLSLRQWEHPSDQLPHFDPPHSYPSDQPVNLDTQYLPGEWSSECNQNYNRFFRQQEPSSEQSPNNPDNRQPHQKVENSDGIGVGTLIAASFLAFMVGGLLSKYNIGKTTLKQFVVFLYLLIGQYFEEVTYEYYGGVGAGTLITVSLLAFIVGSSLFHAFLDRNVLILKQFGVLLYVLVGQYFEMTIHKDPISN